MTPSIVRRGHAPRSSQQGLSLIELMIALAIGLIVLGAMVTVFASSSASRQDIERASRQIENGRYAMQLLSDEIRLAGFYGELAIQPYYKVSVPGIPSPCSFLATDWANGFTVSLTGYDKGGGAPPTCSGSNRAAGSDVLVVRRLSECEAGVGNCDLPVLNAQYAQIAKCASESASSKPYVMGPYGSTDFTQLHERDCTTIAKIRKYHVRIYFVSADNGRGEPIPTLKRVEWDGTSFVETSLVEGIEYLNLEYGIDADGDGAPDAYTADPAIYAASKATDQVSAWQNVVSVRINVLARNIEPTPGYTDNKTYYVGNDSNGSPEAVAPHDSYHHHAYSSVVRVVNVAERKDTP